MSRKRKGTFAIIALEHKVRVEDLVVVWLGGNGTVACLKLQSVFQLKLQVGERQGAEPVKIALLAERRDKLSEAVPLSVLQKERAIEFEL